MPSITGIAMSRTTRSGWCSVGEPTASSPLAASHHDELGVELEHQLEQHPDVSGVVDQQHPDRGRGWLLGRC